MTGKLPLQRMFELIDLRRKHYIVQQSYVYIECGEARKVNFSLVTHGHPPDSIALPLLRMRGISISLFF